MNAPKCYYCDTQTEDHGTQNGVSSFFCRSCHHYFDVPMHEEFDGEYKELFMLGIVSTPSEYIEYCRDRADFQEMIYGDNPYRFTP